MKKDWNLHVENLHLTSKIGLYTRTKAKSIPPIPLLAGDVEDILKSLFLTYNNKSQNEVVKKIVKTEGKTFLTIFQQTAGGRNGRLWREND